MTPRRGYSKAFTPRDRATAKRYLLDDIPPALWIAARAKAKRNGLSMRALLLQSLTNYVAAVAVVEEGVQPS